MLQYLKLNDDYEITYEQLAFFKFKSDKWEYILVLDGR